MSRGRQKTHAPVDKTLGTQAQRDALFGRLGVTMPVDLGTQALTHRSYAYEVDGAVHNERLEFLGDSVLGIAVTERLFRQFPDRPEGDLAKMRANTVSMYALAKVARELGLGAALRLGKGEELSNGRDKNSILADAMEAVFGAIHLEHGIEVSRRVVLSLFEDTINRAGHLGAGLDWKTSLQEIAAAKHLGVPRYYITSTGPDHNKRFFATGIINDRAWGRGEGHNKKEAEQVAAHNSWTAIDTGETGAAVSTQAADAMMRHGIQAIDLETERDLPRYADEIPSTEDPSQNP